MARMLSSVRICARYQFLGSQIEVSEVNLNATCGQSLFFESNQPHSTLVLLLLLAQGTHRLTH